MKGLLKIISTYTLINIVIGGFSFVLMSVLTFYLKPDDYALIQLSNGFVKLFTIIISFGTTHMLMTKLYNNSADEIKTSFSSFFYYSLFITVFYSITLLLSAFFTDNLFGVPIEYMWLMPLIAFLTIVYEFTASLFIFREQTMKFTLISFLKFGVETGAIILLIIVLGFGWLGRIEALIVSLMVSVGLFTRYLTRQGFFSSNFSFRVYFADFKTGLPLIVFNLSIFVFDISDRFFLEKMTSLSETGIYSTAYTYSNVMILIGGAVVNAIRPKIYAQLSEGKFNLGKLFYLNFSLQLLVFVTVLLCNNLVFDYFIDSEYTRGRNLTFPMALGFLCWSIYIFFNSILMFYNKNGLVAKISILGIVLNLALNYALIKRFGAIGATYATCISCFCITIFSWYFYVRLIHSKQAEALHKS
ncbi:MAG: lipopolysaccharide biosynthesis protein [Bacteroidota bacterium]